MADLDTVMGGLPPELLAQQQAIRRREMINQMMMQRATLSPELPQNSGRLMSKQSALAPFAQIAAGLAANRGMKQGDEDTLKLAQDYKSMKNAAVEKYLATRGTDPNLAMREAMTSDFPQVSHLGQADMTLAAKQTLTPENLLSNADKYTPESFGAAVKAYQAGDKSWPGLLKPKGTVHSAGDSLVETVPGQSPKVLGYYGPEWEKNQDGSPKITMINDVTTGKPEPYQRNSKTGELKKLDNATKISVTQTQGAEGAFAKGMGGGQAKLVEDTLKESRASAQEAVKDLTILGTAINTYNKGIATGSNQSLRTEIGKFAETYGFKSNDPKVSSTDVFMRQMASRILQHTKELRPMSDADSNLLQDIYAGKNLTDDAIRRLLEIGVSQGLGAIEAHNGMVDEHAKLPGAIPQFKKFYGVTAPNGLPKLKAQMNALPKTQKPNITIDPQSGAEVRPQSNRIMFEEMK